MGGSNKKSGPAVAAPEIRRATLPTSQDYRFENAAQRKDQNRADMAEFIVGATKNIGKHFSEIGALQPKPLSQWKSVQQYSKNPSSGSLQFTPLSPIEVYDDESSAVPQALASSIGNMASGVLSGLSYRGSGLGSNINYKG
jgi:hypothetical protein